MRVVMLGHQAPVTGRCKRGSTRSTRWLAMVVTHPQSDHASQWIWDDAVAHLAARHGLPLLARPRPDHAELLSRLTEGEPDVVVATNRRTWIPPQVFTLPAPGTLDVHDVLGNTGWTRQDRSRASLFHKRSIEDSRIDRTWPAEGIANLVRVQSDPYPNAFTFHCGKRIRIHAASVSEKHYVGTPGRIVIREETGVVVVAGADTPERPEPGPRDRVGAYR